MGVEGRNKQKILEAGALASVRWRRVRSHVIRNLARETGQAPMVSILKAAME